LQLFWFKHRLCAYDNEVAALHEPNAKGPGHEPVGLPKEAKFTVVIFWLEEGHARLAYPPSGIGPLQT
jgi:hypothetical protein